MLRCSPACLVIATATARRFHCSECSGRCARRQFQSPPHLTSRPTVAACGAADCCCVRELSACASCKEWTRVVGGSQLMGSVVAAVLSDSGLGGMFGFECPTFITSTNATHRCSMRGTCKERKEALEGDGEASPCHYTSSCKRYQSTTTTVSITASTKLAHQSDPTTPDGSCRPPSPTPHHSALVHQRHTVHRVPSTCS